MIKVAALRSIVVLGLWLTLPLQAGMADPAPPGAGAKQPELIWCLNHLPYFHEYDTSDTPTGTKVELIRELARRAGFSVSFTPRTTLSRCLRLMEQGEADLMTNLKFSDERSQFMYLLPYSDNIAESLFMRTTDPRLIDSKAQLRGLTLATLRHILYNPATMALIAEESRHITQVDSIEVALEMLLRNRIDGFVAPTISTSEAIAAVSSYQHRFKIAPLDFSSNAPNQLHLALAKNSQHAALEPLLRRHLQEMITDGTVASMIRKPANRTHIIELKQQQP